MDTSQDQADDWPRDSRRQRATPDDSPPDTSNTASSSIGKRKRSASCSPLGRKEQKAPEQDFGKITSFGTIHSPQRPRFDRTPMHLTETHASAAIRTYHDTWEKMAPIRDPIAAGGLPQISPDSTYTPLRDPTRQIRLLKIKQDEDEDTINCSLSSHELERVSHSYIAVSYTWGDDLDPKLVHIDGRPVTVRHNCWYALKQIKLYNPRSPLWIDSLCIDQGNHGEKTLQVRQMSQIYSHALEVVACLGKDGPDMDLFLEYARHQSKRRLNSTNLSRSKVMAAYTFLASRPYFSRLWVVQECVLGQCVEVLIGRSHCSWNNMMAGFSKMLEMSKQGLLPPLDSPTEAMNKNVAAMESLYADAKSYQQGGNLLRRTHLADLLVRYEDRRCFDFRDKVFALLSLAPEKQRSRITPDYNVSPFGVLLATAATYTEANLHSGSADHVDTDLEALEHNRPRDDEFTDWDNMLGIFPALEEGFSVSQDFLDDIARAITTKTSLPPLSQRSCVSVPAKRWGFICIDPQCGDILEPATLSMELTGPSELPSIAIRSDCRLVQHHGSDQCPQCQSTYTPTGRPSLIRSLFGHGTQQVQKLSLASKMRIGQWSYLVPRATEPGDLLYWYRGLNWSYEKTVVFVLRENVDGDLRMLGLAQAVTRTDIYADQTGWRTNNGPYLVTLKVHQTRLYFSPTGLVLFALTVHAGLGFLCGEAILHFTKRPELDQPDATEDESETLLLMSMD